jgi:hypothetical protein
MGVPNPGFGFFFLSLIPDSGVKKEQDPGSRSATLEKVYVHGTGTDLFVDFNKIGVVYK